jgi:serine/threonine-protein kinase
MEGRVLGDRYRVISRLGEGGMGAVYLCEHAVLHRRFAVKVLRPDLAKDPELVDRFRNEAIAASRIGVENVVDVVDFGVDPDGALYYVMEALDGRSLGALIRDDGPLLVPRALELLEQICRALVAAHARGVVHRDVKPDNVFVVRREDGTELAKVIDFGISHVPPPAGAGRITRAGSIIGTPEYMAPEQAAGEAVDRRVDVYAAGVLAYEMLTGMLPIEAATPLATLVAHQTRAPDPPSRHRAGIPREVDALVLHALAKRPQDRFESMEALAAAVARVRLGLGRVTATYRTGRARGDTVALPAGAGEALERLRLRERRGLPVLIAAFAGAAAILVGGWLAAAGATAPPAARRSIAAAIPMPRAAAVPFLPAHAAGTPTPIPTATSTAPPTPTATSTATTPTATPTTAPTPTTTPTPTPTATPTATPTPIAGAAAPALVEERAALAPAATPEPLRPAKKASRRPAAPRPGVSPEDELKDPYSGGGALKDPFQ